MKKKDPFYFLLINTMQDTLALCMPVLYFTTSLHFRSKIVTFNSYHMTCQCLILCFITITIT